MAWVAFDGKAYVAGTLGAGATFTLPSGEIGLDAHDSLVLSTDAAKSTLILRDLVSGAVVAERKTGLTIDNGLVMDNRVYVSARTADGSGDAGVLSGAIPDLSLGELLPAVTGGPEVGGTRAWIRISPSGRTFGSTVCTTEIPCVTQVVSGDQPVQTIDDYYLRWLSDDVVIVWQGAELRAYSLANGSLVWTISDDTAEFDEAYFLSDGETLILGWSHGIGSARTYEVTTVNVVSGSRASIAEYPGDTMSLWLQPAMSNDRHVTFLSEPLLGGNLLETAKLRVLDLSTKDLREYASRFSGGTQ